MFDWDYDDLMLMEDKTNLGRKIYILSIMGFYLFTFFTVIGRSELNLFNCTGAFILSAIVAMLCQVRVFFFNDLFISTIYRFILIWLCMTICYYMASFNITELSFNKNPSQIEFFFVGTPILCLSIFLVGAILSLPFKLLSFVFGRIDCTMYYKNPPGYSSNKKIYSYDVDLLYAQYNETQLEALRNIAITEEDYEEAQRITDYLRRKYYEDE